MSYALTIAGIKFCAALLGVDNPTYDDCNTAVYKVGMYADRWYRSPTAAGSMPNPFKKPEGYKECIEWAIYDIMDGPKGTSYFCWRPAKYVFDINTATFHWVLE
jgi:hypothetical protein